MCARVRACVSVRESRNHPLLLIQAGADRGVSAAE